MNKAMLIGNVGAAPEVKAVGAKKTPVARFSLATTRTWKNAKGEKQSETQWHRCVVWGKPAEVVQKYVAKGTKLQVEGEIQYRDYEDKGVKKSITEIRVLEFNILSKKAGDAPTSARVSDAERDATF